MSKNKLLTLRVPEQLLNDYKKLCEEGSFTLSKRVRRLLELDIERWKKFKQQRSIDIKNEL
jgi:antitoxin component of RelBE/YafQ-DinJ toxin-antitoxin module